MENVFLFKWLKHNRQHGAGDYWKHGFGVMRPKGEQFMHSVKGNKPLEIHMVCPYGSYGMEIVTQFYLLCIVKTG